MDALVRLDDVRKSFGATSAVDGVTASIPAGRVTGLVGADGAGKTTLLRLMAGLLAPDGGALSAVDALGYMPQRFGLYEDLSVAENLSLYADLRGLAPQLVIGAGLDCLLDDSLRLAARLRAAGNTVHLSVYDGVPHSFMQLSAHLEPADTALHEAAGILATAFSQWRNRVAA